MMPRLLPLGIISLLVALGPMAAAAFDWFSLAIDVTKLILAL